LNLHAMSFFPSRHSFIEQAKAGIIRPVYLEIPFIQPVEAFLQLSQNPCFFFDSARGPYATARYSFIGIEPFLTVTLRKGTAEANRLAQTLEGDSLSVLKGLMQKYKVTGHDELPPFPGGAACLINYDFVRYIENIPAQARDDLNLAEAYILFVDSTVSFDMERRQAWIQACPGAKSAYLKEGKPSEDSWGRHYDEACCNIAELYQRLKHNSAVTGPQLSKQERIVITHEMDKQSYMDIVRRAKEYIRAGDIFQANLSQRLAARVDHVDPVEVYTLLRKINPSPFAAYMALGDNLYIVSSSPERLVQVHHDGIVETRPIAGTRPRGADMEGDKLMRAELLLNHKERAEHIMLIDLERNDLGRISEYGSVVVNELMTTEDYSHVIHIVSNIQGRLRQGRDCIDVIKAVFPGGTITGVPKVRCMEIIDELEPVARGPYTGSLGYISFTGDMDLNIIIRTIVMKDGMAYVQAGAGIVADSDPEREYYETLSKAEALIQTLKRL